MTFVQPLTAAESQLLSYVQTWSSFSLVEVGRDPFSSTSTSTPVSDGASQLPALEALTQYIHRSHQREDELLTALGVPKNALRKTHLPNENFRNYLRRGGYAWLAVEPAASYIVDDLWQLNTIVERSHHRILVWQRNCGRSIDVPRIAGQDNDILCLRECFLSRIMLAKTALEESRDGREAIAFLFNPDRRRELGVLGSEQAMAVYCGGA